MSATLRSSVIETLMLVLFVVWAVAFSLALFHPEIGLANMTAVETPVAAADSSAALSS